MWISEPTCSLEDQRISQRRRHLVDQQELRMAARRFQASLQEDRIWKVGTMGMDIESPIAAGHMRKAWKKIQWWYQQVKGHPKPPNREGLEHTSNMR